MNKAFFKAVFFLTIVSLISCTKDQPAENKTSAAAMPQMPPSAVSTTKPVVGEMKETINIVGSLSANESALISSEIAGTIAKVHVQDGQMVSAGQLLFSINADALQAELKNALATIELRKLEKQRLEALLQQKVASQYDVDKASTELLTATANRDLAQALLDKTQVKAPFAGNLGIRKVNEGSYVKMGSALIDLVQLNPLLLDFSVPETALSTLTVGEKINVLIPSMPEQQMSAKILAIEPAMNTVSRSVKVRASVNNENLKLRPGLFARIELPINSNDKVLWIPEAAIFYQGEQKLVLINDAGKALHKEVTVGSYQNGQVAILSGLNETDEVVVGGHHKAPFDGMPLMVVNAKAESTDKPETHSTSTAK